MNATPDTKDTPKLEELSHAQLVQLLSDALERLKKANELIESLEKKLNDTLPPKLPVPYSVSTSWSIKSVWAFLSENSRVVLFGVNKDANPAVAPINNEAERTLRDPATTRRVGRTNKTLHGARRQTIFHSVFESIRTQIPKFTLQGVLDEIANWKTQGESCFTRLLNVAGLTPNEASVSEGKPICAHL